MHIIIIGGGFAGVAAAKKLKFLSKKHNVTLIDRFDCTCMLPSLPDVAGGQVAPEMLTEKITSLIPSTVQFVQDTIESVDFKTKQIKAAKQIYTYDYLVLASGSKTNFFGFNENIDKIYTLETLEDSLKVLTDFTKILESGKKVNPVISGAGFTGLELASNLYRLGKKYGKTLTITLVEKFGKILGGVSEDMVSTVEQETSKLSFNIIKNDSVTQFDGSTVTLASGTKIENAFFCWCSGVKQPIPVVGNHQKLGDDRIIVDQFLRIPEHKEVFVTGDAAAFKHNEMFLRRSVNYAAMAGSQAGTNIINTIAGKPVKRFIVIDMGWVIPVNLTSIGEAMGVPVKGRLGILMHYVICGAKNYNLGNFIKYCFAAVKFAIHGKNYPK